MKLQQLLKDRREDILTIAARHGAFNVRVFGSVSRGEETENSDIDLLIDYDLTKTSAWFPGGLLMDLQDLLVGEASQNENRKVDIVTEQGLSHLIKDRVLAEAKSL
jgi:uncharacterized protein